jgi:glycosyltransferase involved in cell wall biosynthesis
MRPSEPLLGASVAFIAYSYGGYPFLLWLLSQARGREVRKETIEPPVSLIIAAHNEEVGIRDKVENALAQDYPPAKLDIIVASDCSTDRTDEIVLEYRARGVRLIRTPDRKGKEAAQKRALDAATGQILVFSDTATILPTDAVRNIVRNFGDPSVGCVSSVDRLRTEGGKPDGEGAYVRYEMLLRRLETRIGTVVGLSGSFFAARREVCQPWRPDLQSDFNTLLNAVERGFRGVSDPDSVGYYRTIADPQREYDRKVRTVLRGITVLANRLSLLNPLRYGFFSWQIVSHKLFRWLVPYALVIALVANSFLAPTSRGYLALLWLQGSFYVLALCALTRPSMFRYCIFSLPGFAVQVNASILHAWYLFYR